MIDTETRYLLEDMLGNARLAQDCIRGRTVDDFSVDKILILAATRAVEIVGEAAYQMKSDMQVALPTIPWRAAIGMRHKLVHGYRKLNPLFIYKTIVEDFPALIAELERILNERPNDGA